MAIETDSRGVQEIAEDFFKQSGINLKQPICQEDGTLNFPVAEELAIKYGKPHIVSVLESVANAMLGVNFFPTEDQLPTNENST